VGGADCAPAQLQQALSDRLAGQPEPYVVLRASRAVSPVALQELLQRAWLAGAPEVLLQEAAPVGNLDAVFIVEPSERHGSDWSWPTRDHYFHRNQRPPYVSVARPAGFAN
jgi:hypothetical protein